MSTFDMVDALIVLASIFAFVTLRAALRLWREWH
jgi:hypothetical protein